MVERNYVEVDKFIYQLFLCRLGKIERYENKCLHLKVFPLKNYLSIFETAFESKTFFGIAGFVEILNWYIHRK